MRELGPILIAFIVTARSATAIATEISTMVVRHEIEAYIYSYFGCIYIVTFFKRLRNENA